MAMITISYDEQLREAFAAGQASMMPLVKGVKKTDVFRVPRTYEEWLESISNRPIIVRG